MSPSFSLPTWNSSTVKISSFHTHPGIFAMTSQSHSAVASQHQCHGCIHIARKLVQLCWPPGRHSGMDLSSSLTNNSAQWQTWNRQDLHSQTLGKAGANKERDLSFSFLGYISCPCWPLSCLSDGLLCFISTKFLEWLSERTKKQ